MDPLTAISLTANIFQFVDIGIRLVKESKEIAQSTSGLTHSNEGTQRTIKQIQDLTDRIQSQPSNAKLSNNDTTLRDLVAECRELSDQIVGLLEAMAPKSRSVRERIKSTIKQSRGKYDVEQLEKRLNRCREQLHVQFTAVTSAETQEELFNLADSAQKGNARLVEVQSQLKQLETGFRENFFSSTAKESLRGMLGITESVQRKVGEQLILQRLEFSGMQQRFDDVIPAHEETFNWILETDNVGHADQMSASAIDARDRFVSWLSSGDDTFHIAGKLGSGKSTLMKFLCRDRRTEALLQKWAGMLSTVGSRTSPKYVHQTDFSIDGRELVFTKFFFWRPGSLKLQKSIPGLLRTLLYNILQKCPELVPVAFPDEWHRIVNLGFNQNAYNKTEFEEDTVRYAFQTLIDHQQLYETHRFCFFIDALDEYDENVREDFGNMVELLKSWTTKSRGGVKICVSSREDLVFENAFPAEKRIRLQDLTRGDMERYVRRKLQGMENEKDREYLTKQIVSRSDGIFLWVVLVVKNLREYIEYEDGIDTFKQELARLPDELEALFEHLLLSVGKTKRKEAYAILTMANTAQSWCFEDPRIRSSVIHILKLRDIRLPLISSLFVKEYISNPDFAISPSFNDCSEHASESRDIQIVKAKKLVRGYCKGLIETRSWDKGENYWLSFTHRTIPEFLERQRTQSQIRDSLKDFNTGNAICQTVLAEIRSTHPRWIACEDKWAELIFSLIYWRHQEAMDQFPYKFLTRFEIATREITEIEMQSKKEETERRERMQNHHQMLKGRVIYDFSSVHEISSFKSPLLLQSVFEKSAFLDHCIRSGSPLLANNDFRTVLITLLLAIMLGYIPVKFESVSYDRMLSQLGTLLEIQIPSGFFCRWVDLIHEVRIKLFFRSDAVKPWTQRFGSTVALFLRHTFDKRYLDIKFQSVIECDSGHRLNQVLLGEGMPLSISHRPRYLFKAGRDELYNFELDDLSGETVPLREMVKRWNLENTEEIFSILDELEAASQGEWRPEWEDPQNLRKAIPPPKTPIWDYNTGSLPSKRASTTATEIPSSISKDKDSTQSRLLENPTDKTLEHQPGQPILETATELHDSVHTHLSDYFINETPEGNFNLSSSSVSEDRTTVSLWLRVTHKGYYISAMIGALMAYFVITIMKLSI